MAAPTRPHAARHPSASHVTPACLRTPPAARPWPRSGSHCGRSCGWVRGGRGGAAAGGAQSAAWSLGPLRAPAPRCALPGRPAALQPSSLTGWAADGPPPLARASATWPPGEAGARGGVSPAAMRPAPPPPLLPAALWCSIWRRGAPAPLHTRTAAPRGSASRPAAPRPTRHRRPHPAAAPAAPAAAAAAAVAVAPMPPAAPWRPAAAAPGRGAAPAPRGRQGRPRGPRAQRPSRPARRRPPPAPGRARRGEGEGETSGCTHAPSAPPPSRPAVPRQQSNNLTI